MYDDVAYMLDATKRLNTLEQGGLAKVAEELWKWPPHAPLSTLMAAAGFSIFGRVDWAPYAVNSLVIAVWLGLWSYLFRSRLLWERTLLLAIAAFMPMTLMAVQEFRPDMLAASVLGWCLVLTLEGPLLSATTGRLLQIGALLGLAVIAKPSTFPSTIAVAGSACALASLLDTSLPQHRRPVGVARAAGLVLTGMLVIAAPYMLIGWGHIHAYITDNIFGYRKHMWVTPGDTEFHLRYYIDRKGGQFQLGYFAYPVLGLAVLGPAVSRRYGEPGQRRRSLALAMAITVAWGVASINLMKQPFLGLHFQVLLVVAALLTLRMLMERGPRLAGRRIAVASCALPLLMLLACVTFRWPNRWGTLERHDQFRHGVRLFHEIDGVLKDRLGDRPGGVFVTFTGIVNETNLELMAHRRRTRIHFVSREVAATMEDYEPFIARCQYVLAAESGTGITNDRFPNARLQDQVVARLDQDPAFRRVYETTGIAPDRKIILYARAGR
jgi:hypothetical protein